MSNLTFSSFLDFKRRYPIRPNDEGALLGSGSYGRVIKVEDQLETEWVAIKISEFKGNDAKSLKAEVELAKRIPRQANIARYEACYRLETDTSVSDFAIMKYYPDGNLADLFRRAALSPDQIYDLTKGILLGLQHLHKQRIVHRDFKPANILISRDNAGRFIPKIADFGLSKLVSDDELDRSDFDLSDGRGTPSYKAPEQIEGSRVSFNLDLWAFGVILFEMLTGEKPFRADLSNTSEQSARREIEKKIITVALPSRLSQIKEPYQAIIRRCLVRDIHERVRKEDELLDLLDHVPQLLREAQLLFVQQNYLRAIELFEQVLTKRELHVEAQKGLEQCTLQLRHQQVFDLMSQANRSVDAQLFDQACSCYQQVLLLQPNHPEATQGLANCLDKLQPQIGYPIDKTDVFQLDETDVFVAPISSPRAPVIERSVSTVGEIAPKVHTAVKAFGEPVVSRSIGTPEDNGTSLTSTPWRVMSLIGILIALGSAFFFLRDKSQQSVAQLTATNISLETGTVATIEKITDNVAAGLTDNTSQLALKKRVDVAFLKARKAYLKGDYATVVMLTSSALQLDRNRGDVARLHEEALKAIPRSSPAVTPENSVSLTSTPSPAIEPPKPTLVEEVKESPANGKAQAQEQYDQLMEEGVKAINKENNKPKAINSFTAARSLAKEHDLNTAKAEGAYTAYMAKANKIFDSDEFEGAREWYKVAQALKDTREVQTRIKQCNNQ